MDYITLPRTDIKVSRICLGCWQMNDNKANASWEAQTYETSKACVDKCLELGINFFDTAEGYAGSEEVLGKCLQGRRQDAVIASKFGFREGPFTPAYSAVQIDESITKGLRKLQTNYIDLLQAHFPSFIENTDEALTELKRQVSLGRIKSFGVCNFGPKNLKTLLDKDPSFLPVSNQICYNLLWRSAEPGILPICKEKDIAILAYSPLQQGLLSGNYMTVDDVPMGRRRGKLFSPESCSLGRHGTPGCEKELFEALQSMKGLCTKANVPMAKAALSWVMQQQNKPVVIVGCRTPEQVVENYNVVKISDELVKELTDATEALKDKVGSALDQWATPDRCE
ncbi:1-deoxyxylulose-5-phosphate synthase YajO-like [Mercenaria mercenaria]|uniref:1-deoxyxylulose-5-phosphate synthase YajO-like n=1 Tax=Mercenaria mercenaria TaxID=6596 RepID=UPI00234EC947|nr:1-deoxyxylulose-5-phosphate synthase YajO-like [Mercenaria mercenaria]